MRMKQYLLLSTILLLVVACAGGTVGYGQGDGDTTGQATAVIGDSSHASGSNDLNVDITLPDPPPYMSGVDTYELEYIFQVKNQGASPATIKRISIASAAGNYQLERWSRKFDKTIAAGATDNLPFVARAIGVNSTLGTRAPMKVRAEIEFENAGGRHKTTVLQNVGSVVGIGVESDQ